MQCSGQCRKGGLGPWGLGEVGGGPCGKAVAWGGLELAVGASPASLPVTGCPRCSLGSTPTTRPWPRPYCVPSAPFQMMQNLLLEEGGLVQVESVNLQVATYSKFQPQSPDFLDITNPKAVYPSEDGRVLCGRSCAGGG